MRIHYARGTRSPRARDRPRPLTGNAHRREQIDLGLSDVSVVTAIAPAWQLGGDRRIRRRRHRAWHVPAREPMAASAHRLDAGFAFDFARDGRGILGTARVSEHAHDLSGRRRRAAAAARRRSQPRSRYARCCTDGVVSRARRERTASPICARRHGCVTALTDEGVVGELAVSPDGVAVAPSSPISYSSWRHAAHRAGGRSPARSSAAGRTRGRSTCAHRTPIRVRRIDVATGAATPVLECAAAAPRPAGVSTFVIAEAATRTRKIKPGAVAALQHDRRSAVITERAERTLGREVAAQSRARPRQVAWTAST